MPTPEKLRVPTEAPVAVYERKVAASERRVWENVLDWEHLPWLHSDSFASISCEDAGPWGWRVHVGIEGMAGPRDTHIELLVDRAKSHYVTRTLAGPGAGNEIWTRVTPETSEQTGIQVAFHLDGIPESAREVVGQGFLKLYAKLWDEDEAMMQQRQRVLDAGALKTRTGPLDAVALGDEAALREKLPDTVKAHGRTYHIVSVAGTLRAFPAVCPHWGGPLEPSAIDDGHVVCPWHGYAFDLETGKERGGHRCALRDRAVVAVDVDTGECHIEFQERGA